MTRDPSGRTLRTRPRALQGASAQNDRRGFVRLRKAGATKTALRSFPAKPFPLATPARRWAEVQQQLHLATNKKERKPMPPNCSTAPAGLPPCCEPRSTGGRYRLRPLVSGPVIAGGGNRAGHGPSRLTILPAAARLEACSAGKPRYFVAVDDGCPQALDIKKPGGSYADRRFLAFGRRPLVSVAMMVIKLVTGGA